MADFVCIIMVVRVADFVCIIMVDRSGRRLCNSSRWFDKLR